MRRKPVLGPENPTRRKCSRRVGVDGQGGELLCDAPAAQHIIYRWDEAPAEANPDGYWVAVAVGDGGQ